MLRSVLRGFKVVHPASSPSPVAPWTRGLSSIPSSKTLYENKWRTTKMVTQSSRMASTATLNDNFNNNTNNTNEPNNSNAPKRSWKWYALGALAGLSAVVLIIEYSESAQCEPGKRKRVVVLGTGWAALSLLQELDSKYFDVTVISPRNYFLFTPLLPSVTVGTLDARSITEPIRRYCRKPPNDVAFLEAECTDIDPVANTVRCKVACDTVHAEVKEFDVPYDQLIVAVGAINNTFNTPGVTENCHFLKEVEDAEKIRKKIMDCFENASLPHQSEEEKNRLLHFVVVGGGPNGVEFAAELHDFVQDNLVKYFSHLIPKVKITIVEMLDHILNTYDAKISAYTEKHFQRSGIELKTKHGVTAVQDKNVLVKNITNNEITPVPYGLCVWSTGIGPSPLVAKLTGKFTGTQTNRRAIVTDDRLRVLGSKNIFALGDCATIQQKLLLDKFVDLFEASDTNHDGVLSLDEFKEMIAKYSKNYSQLEAYGAKAEALFQDADTNKDRVLTKDEFKSILAKADSTLKRLPATAQVASQQGTYLGKAFNKRAHFDLWDKLGADEIPQIDPFRYRHFGSFAYIGSETAVADFEGKVSLGGFGVWWLWRSIYLSKQFSLRNKLLVATDWTKTLLFGRDITRN